MEVTKKMTNNKQNKKREIRASINIPVELNTKLKIVARRKGMSKTKFIVEIISKEINKGAWVW